MVPQGTETVFLFPFYQKAGLLFSNSPHPPTREACAHTTPPTKQHASLPTCPPPLLFSTASHLPPVGHHMTLPRFLWFPLSLKPQYRGSPLPWTPVRVSSARPPPEVGSPRGLPLTMWPAPPPQHPSLSLAYGPRSLGSVPGREVEVLVPRPACLSGCPAPAAPGLPRHTTHHGQATWPWDQYSPAHVSCQSELCSK